MGPRTPPRFVTRTMATTFATVVLMLGSVLLVVTFPVRNRVRDSVTAHLTTQQGMLQTLEQRRMSDAEVVQALATVIPTLRTDDSRYDTAAARAARKSALVAFSRP